MIIIKPKVICTVQLSHLFDKIWSEQHKPTER